MLQVYRGRVKFFKRDKGFGFITPTEKGGSDVFFHTKYFSGVANNFMDELELEFIGDCVLTQDYREPKSGDSVVYSEYNDPKGLMAVNWAFAGIWNRGLKMKQIFKEYDGGFIRVMRIGTRENRFRPELIWKSTLRLFRSWLDQTTIIFDDSMYTEELDIASRWVRSYRDPRNWHDKYKKTASHV